MRARSIVASVSVVFASFGCSPLAPRATASPSGAAPRATATRPRPSDVTASVSSRVVKLALRQVGAPYAWGGDQPSGFDCSGLVHYVYATVGVELPHNVARQYRRGVPVTRDKLRPGDVVFFDGLRHNGIYIGEGRFVHAAVTPDAVVISRLDERWYARRWVGARRLLDATSTVRR